MRPSTVVILGCLVAGCGGGGSSSSPPPAPAPNANPLDTTFGSGGVVLSNPTVREDVPEVLLADATDLYLIGTDEAWGSGNTQIRIEKRSQSTGALDSSFAAGVGTVQWNVSSGDDRFVDGLIDGTAMILVGYDEAQGIGNKQWRIARRHLSSGGWDTNFNGGSPLQLDFGTGDDTCEAVASDGTYFYVVGTEHISGSDTRWRIEKRDLATGALETATFGTSGVVTIDPTSGGEDKPRDIWHRSGSLYVVGYDTTAGASDHQWRIVKLSASTGAVDGSFGTSGVETANPGSGVDQPVRVVTDGSNNLYVGGLQQLTGSDFQQRIEKRSAISGPLSAAFGTGGVVTANPSTNAGLEVAALFIDGGLLYVGGSDFASGNARWRMERRTLLNGTVDTTFGVAGVLTVDPSGNDDEPVDVVFTATHFFVLGTDRSAGASNAQWRLHKHTK